MKDNKEKIDVEGVNSIIHTSKIVLKFVIMGLILGLIIGLFIIIEKTELLKIFVTILSLLVPLFVGWVLAWLVEPLIKLLERKNVNRKLGTTIVYLLFMVVMVLLIVLVVPEFINQLKELISQLPNYLSKVKDFISNLFNRFDTDALDIAAIQNDINTQLEKYVTDFTSNGLTGIVSVVTSILSSGLTVGLSLIIAFYFSLGFDKMAKKVNNTLPKTHRNEIINILGQIGDMTRRYVNGTLFSSLIVTIFTFIGLLISGVSSPLLFAIFCGVTNIIPYFGPYIGGIPTIIVGFSISPLCGIVCLVTILLVQMVEGNVINPIIVGKATDMHPITIIIGLIIFGHFFGIVGMVLATPIMGAAKILFNYFNNKYHLINRLLNNNKVESE
jgi:predicted PurR-regulated permease PerM